jgi:hypothetical protein
MHRVASPAAVHDFNFVAWISGESGGKTAALQV